MRFVFRDSLGADATVGAVDFGGVQATSRLKATGTRRIVYRDSLMSVSYS